MAESILITNDRRLIV